ncbi:uncharacterized protein LOC144061641 isoform X3 [Vanacampus margaritifer]
MTKSPAPAEHELVHNKTVDCISLLTRGPRPFPRLCRWKAAVGILLSDIPRVQNRKEEKPNCKGSEKDDNGRPRTQGRSCDGLRLRWKLGLLCQVKLHEGLDKLESVVNAP